MLRLRSYWGDALLRFIAVATMIIVAVAVVTQYDGGAGYGRAQYNSSGSAAEPTQPESFWERTETDPVATFTGVLALLTFALVVVSAVQIFYLNRADKTARITAEAARLSAISAERALEQTSEPYLDVSVALKDAAVHRLPGGGVTIQFMGSEFAEYTVYNYGQGPAIILEIYQHCVRSPGLPGRIPFPPPQSNLLKVATVGGQKESPPFSIPFPHGWLDNLYAGPPVWIGLQIRYRDVFRNQYVSIYCGAFNPQRATFVAYGGQDYNGRRKLTDDERRIAEERDAIL